MVQIPRLRVRVDEEHGYRASCPGPWSPVRAEALDGGVRCAHRARTAAPRARQRLPAQRSQREIRCCGSPAPLKWFPLVGKNRWFLVQIDLPLRTESFHLRLTITLALSHIV